MCEEQDAKMLEIGSLLQLNFLISWFSDQSDNVESVHLGYRRHTNTIESSENMEYLSFDGMKQFKNEKFSLTNDPNINGNCLSLQRSDNGFNLKQNLCTEDMNYVCMKHQQMKPESSWSLEKSLQLLLPLDRVSTINSIGENAITITQHLVAFSEDGCPSKLNGSASFLREYPSHIQIPESNAVKTQFGLTVLAWVLVRIPLNDDEKIYIFDENTEDDNGFSLFIQMKNSKLILGAKLCSEDNEQVVTCDSFTSHESMELKMDIWTYVGFTFSTDDMEGTFFVNEAFGAATGSNFYYNTNHWLKSPMKGAFVGNDRMLNKGFGGEISCLQIYEYRINAAQSWDLQRCPVPGYCLEIYRNL